MILDRAALDELIRQAIAGEIDRTDHTVQRGEITLAAEVMDSIIPSGDPRYVADFLGDDRPCRGELVRLARAESNEWFVGIVVYSDPEDSGSYRLTVYVVHADGAVGGRWGNSIVERLTLGPAHRERALRPGYHPKAPRTRYAARIVGDE